MRDHSIMSRFIQIALLTFVIQDHGTFAKPFFENISVKKNFEVNFKPMPFKPLSFVSEKWTPFGIFKKKHSIEKRAVIPVEIVTPVKEELDEINEHSNAPFLLLPSSIEPVLSVEPVTSTMIPVISTPIPPILITPEPPKIVEITPKPEQPSPSPFPLATDKIVLPIVVPPVSTNFVLFEPEKNEVSGDKAVLYTDISKAEPVKEFIESRVSVPLIVPPVEEKPAIAEEAKPPKEEEEPAKLDITLPGTIVRGTKIALYFGNVFLQLMTQFLSNARATIDQLSSPPVYKE